MTQSTRRRFLLAASAGAALSARAQSARRPNVVYILTDDQRWDLLSLRGHPFVNTPNMDRIGIEGALFLNSFVTTSLCSPSRASYLTGRYPHQHKVHYNASSEVFDKQEVTFPAALRRAGYNTAYIGKWHIGKDPSPRPGFDYWAALPGQGVYFNPSLNVNGDMRAFSGHVDSVTSSIAVEFLEKHRDPAKPFCLCLGIKSPHAEQLPPPELQHALDDVEIPKPPGWQENYADTGKPEAVANSCIEVDRFFDGPRQMKGGWDRFIKDFYRSVMSADQAVGRVLDALDRLKLTENTFVVFAGDNGFFLGEHRLVDKRFAYEEALRVPLLMRYPGVIEPATVVPAMALNIDIFPTILDYCGVPVPGNVAGKSLRPLLSSAKTPVSWRTEMFYDYRERIWQTPALTAVRTERYKLIEYLDPPVTYELYDLIVDPGEMRNVAGVARYASVQADMKKRLDKLKRETGWTPPDVTTPNTPCLSRAKPVPVPAK